MSVDPARESSVKILTRIESSDARVRELLDEALRQGAPEARMNAQDAGLLQELVYGTLRARGRLDFYLSKVCHRSLDALSPWVRNLLRVSLYQILELDRVPVAAVVDQAAEISKGMGHEGVVKFVNGVLRELARQKEEEKLPPLPADPVLSLSVSSSHPLWMAERLSERYGFDRARDLMEASNTAPPTTLRVNPLRRRRDEVAGNLQHAGFEVEACRFSPWGLRVKDAGDLRRLPGFGEGDFYAQDESSQLVARLLDVQPGWQVADVCAAPGGKATHLAELVGPGGLVWAFDRKNHGLDKLQSSLRRQGLNHLLIEVRDALFPKDDLCGRLDAVLVDAPCSGLGVLRRRVEARWQVRPESIPQQSQRQKRILEASGRYLKPGGVMVYATCTLEEKENEEVVRQFLDDNPDFAFERAGNFLERELVTSDGYFRVWPGQDKMDGFFAARLRRLR
ncbi:MAG: 16S rRNA (cytosine(967)-C(5))-methyltransferase RsmB [candidate division FCPU426 bacterium]